MLSGQISVQGKSLACRVQFSCTQVWMCIEIVCSAPTCLQVTFPARFFSIHNLFALFSCDFARHCWPLKVTLLKPVKFHAPFVARGNTNFPITMQNHVAKHLSASAAPWIRVNASITGLAPWCHTDTSLIKVIDFCISYTRQNTSVIPVQKVRSQMSRSHSASHRIEHLFK